VKVDVFGRFQLEVTREAGEWIVTAPRDGKRLQVSDAIIPAHFIESEILAYLDDMYHEAARPGERVRRIE
jgi:hypothetical protein